LFSLRCAIAFFETTYQWDPEPAMKNRGTTALIALFFAGLVGLWVADSWQSPSSAERDRQKGRVLVGLIKVKPDDLQKIEIDGGSAPLVFERREGRRWQMTAPLDVAADPSMVEGLAFRLKELTRKPQADTLKGDPASFGLAPASKTIRLWGKSTDAPLATLELGMTSLDRRFVRAGSNSGIEVVSAQGLEVVDLAPIRWRDRELFRVPTFEVDAVRITSPNRDIHLQRGSDAWRIVEPIKALAEESKIEGLVAGLGSLRVTDDAQFLDNDVAGTRWDRYGLSKPSLTIRVSAGRGNHRRPEQVLEVGKPVEGNPDRLYAKLGDQDDLIAVDARVLADLTKIDPNQFRTSKVADVAPNKATRFRVESGSQSFEVARSGNDWYLVKPLVGRADSKAVQEFFQALQGLRTGDILPPSVEADRVSGIKTPSQIIQVWQTKDSKTATEAASSEGLAFTIRIGNRDAGKKVVYAQTEGDTSILALPDAMTTNLPTNSLAFRDRLVLTTASDQIERIRFDGLGKRVTIQAPILKLDLFRNATTGWWMSEPVNALADGESVGKLLKLLSNLRVVGFAAESPESLSIFGLDAPALKVTWSVPAALPPSPLQIPPASDPFTRSLRFDEQTLLVGSPVSERNGMRYAMLVGQPVVFMLGGETLAILDAEWHDHQVFTFDPNQVEKIHLDWPGTTWSFDLARTEGAWSIIGPVDIPGFDPLAASAIVRAASNLSTSRYSQYGGKVPSGIGLTPPRLALRFSGGSMATPVELAFGGVIDAARGYASAPKAQPGAVFLVDLTPFLAWLKVQPPIRDDMPEDVFMPEPSSDRPGKPTEQPL